jgi:type IV pilus assembly protein PilX
MAWRRRAGGAVLVTQLGMLLGVMVLGASAARLGIDDQQSARNQRDRQLALESAEAALQDALATLAAAVPAAMAGQAPLWQSRALDADGDTEQYGQRSGAVLAAGEGVLPARLPRYLLEAIATPDGAVGDYYRATAIGFGSRLATEVVLQSTVRVGEDGKALRISWREISNWRELHDGAR